MTAFVISETRRISFNLKEFTECLALPEIASDARLPGGPPYVATADIERQTLNVVSGLGDSSRRFAIDAVTLGLLLMRICKLLKLRIPRGAAKHAEFSASALTLVLTMRFGRVNLANREETVRPEQG